MAAVLLCSGRAGEDLCSAQVGSESRLKRQRKKTVTWPRDEKICEVRHYVVDDVPSSLGAAVHENLHCLQGSCHGAQHFSNGVESKRARIEQNDTPPGFGLISIASKESKPNSHLSATMTATIRWQHPCMFLLNPSWLWAGGEESMEIVLQQDRERRFFEAFYPRSASIPDSSLEPQELNVEINSARAVHVPVVPLEEIIDEDTEQHHTHIENEDGVSKVDAMVSPSAAINPTLMEQHDSLSGLADSDIAAVAAAACMVVKSAGNSDLVDERLLLEILKNPSLLQYLTSLKDQMGIEGQDFNKNSASSWQMACKEFKACTLNHEAYSNGSPVSVLGHWVDGVQVMEPCGSDLESTSAQHAVNLTSKKRHLAHTIPPCGNSESSKDVMQSTRVCKQNTENPLSSQPRLAKSSKALTTQELKPTNDLSSKNETRMKASGYGIQPFRLTHLPFKAYTPPTPTNDLPMKVEFIQPEASRRTTMAITRTASTSAYSRARSKAGRLCIFFNSPQGCRNGDGCAFVHQSRDFGAINTVHHQFPNGSISAQ